VFEDDTESFIPDNQQDPLFLFACAIAWRVDRDLDAGWELIRATKAAGAEARALALDLLTCVAVMRGRSGHLLYQRSQLATLQIRGRMHREVSR